MRSLRNLDTSALSNFLSDHVPEDAPGIAAGIVLSANPLEWHCARGRANAELPTLITADMRFRIGSITKQMIGFLVLSLAAEGRISLDTTIGEVIPRLSSINSAATFGSLLGHVSGLRDTFDLTMVFEGIRYSATDDEIAARYCSINDINAEPYQEWRYNNGAYVLISLAIEALLGKDLGLVLRERIFEPLDMRSAMLRRTENDFVPNSATLHMLDADGKLCRDYLLLELSGAGGVVASSRDMLKWMGEFRSATIAPARIFRELAKPLTLRNGRSTGYGLGLACGNFRGHRTLHHAGGLRGGSAMQLAFPDLGLDIFVASNTSALRAIPLAYGLADICLGTTPSPQPRKVVITGAYRSEKTGRVAEFTSVDETQQVSIDGLPREPMWLDGDLLRPFTPIEWPGPLVQLDETRVTLVEVGGVDPLRPVNSAQRSDWRSLLGTFVSDSLGCSAEFSLDEEERPILLLSGGRASACMHLRPLGENLWLGEVASPLLASGVIVTISDDILRVDTERCRNLVLHRIRSL